MRKLLISIILTAITTALPQAAFAHDYRSTASSCTSNHNLEIDSNGVNWCVHTSSTTTGGGGSDFKFSLTNPGFTDLGELIGILITLAMAVGGIFFAAQMFIGGIRWINAGGDPKAVQAARDRITNAFMGIILLAGSYAIIKIVESTLGIRILSGFTIS